MNNSLKCHQDEKLNALIGKRVKITFFDGTVENGILLRKFPYPYQINYLAFFKSHVKKIEEVKV